MVTHDQQIRKEISDLQGNQLWNKLYKENISVPEH